MIAGVTIGLGPKAATPTGFGVTRGLVMGEEITGGRASLG